MEIQRTVSSRENEEQSIANFQDGQSLRSHQGAIRRYAFLKQLRSLRDASVGRLIRLGVAATLRGPGPAREKNRELGAIILPFKSLLTTSL